MTAVDSTTNHPIRSVASNISRLKDSLYMAATAVNHLHFDCFHLVSVYHLPLKTPCHDMYIYHLLNQLIAICARFWMHMDLVNGSIFGHSLFWARGQDGVPFREDSFGRRHFSDNWSSCTNKYKKSDKIWLVEYNLFSRCAKKEKNLNVHPTYPSRKQCQFHVNKSCH